MLRVRHREALETASTTSQVTALSLLVSMYLQSVYAASSEEIEIFLSPVASRSRVREAVRGLSATRQIQSLSMDAQTYYFPGKACRSSPSRPPRLPLRSRGFGHRPWRCRDPGRKSPGNGSPGCAGAQPAQRHPLPLGAARHPAAGLGPRPGSQTGPQRAPRRASPAQPGESRMKIPASPGSPGRLLARSRQQPPAPVSALGGERSRAPSGARQGSRTGPGRAPTHAAAGRAGREPGAGIAVSPCRGPSAVERRAESARRLGASRQRETRPWALRG